MFFATAIGGDLLCDCVFVIAEVVPISRAERRYPAAHPIRHYHFDQGRNSRHAESMVTRFADPNLSFVPSPPVSIGLFIDEFVAARKLTVQEYFSMTKIKNVRAITHDAQALYDRVSRMASAIGRRRRRLSVSCLRPIKLDYPIPGVKIDWSLR